MTDSLPRIAEALQGRYRIERELGQGGMATVYLAEDLKHDRKVALKVLKPELAAVLGAERFVIEIKTTAALQHPHILPLFDSGSADGFLYYVMPYIDGETLRRKLDRETQLGIEESVRIATDVASALHYAHQHGVIHRDIKPENILLHDGRPMVADFGIALAVSAAAGGRMTETGLSLGTPHYMSPEQATAEKEITGRSDVYSLASVLYEMLTGNPPHTGASAQQIIMKIVTEEAASVTKLRKSVPPNVAAAVAQALEKLPADRFDTAARFAEALRNPGFSSFTASAAAPAGLAARSDRWRLIAFAAGALAAVLLAVALWGWLRPAATAAGAVPATQFGLELPPGVSLPPPGANYEVSVSPDGDAVAFIGWMTGGPRLFLRTLKDLAVKEIPGTAGATFSFFAPDGRSIGFVAQGRMRRVNLSGEGAATITTLQAGFAGATWGADDVILYARGNSGLWRVSANGGESQQVTAPDTGSQASSHVQPRFLPDGKSFVFTIYRGRNNAQLATGTLDGRVQELGRAGFRPQYVGSGQLLYSTPAGELMAARFDPARKRITGASVLVVDGLRVISTGNAIWSSSPNGTLVLDRGSATSRLVMVDRTGRIQPLSDDARDFRLPRISPDGNRIAVQVSRIGEDGIWILDRRTGTLARFTSGGTFTDPVWTPDGRRLAFATTGTQGSFDIYWQSADGSGSPEPLVTAPGNQWPWSWTPDGGTLIYDENAPGRPTRISAATLQGGAPPRVVVESKDSPSRLSTLSRDGRWLAYASNETGRWEVYVRPFPGPGGKQQISLAGGDQPVWSRDGRELFYRDGSRLVAATLRLGSSDVVVTARTALFADGFAPANATNYDVLPDGRGFVMLQALESTRGLTVMANWLDELRRRMTTSTP